MASVPPAGPTPAPEAASYAVLALDRLNLLIPRQDIRTLEPAVDIDPADPPPNGVGWFGSEQGRWPVFCLSQELELLSRPPHGRRICAVVAAGGRIFGLLCDEVTLLERERLPLHAAPEAMALAGTAITGLAMHAGSVACVSSAARLLAHAQAER